MEYHIIEFNKKPIHCIFGNVSYLKDKTQHLFDMGILSQIELDEFYNRDYTNQNGLSNRCENGDHLIIWVDGLINSVERLGNLNYQILNSVDMIISIGGSYSLNNNIDSFLGMNYQIQMKIYNIINLYIA